MLWAAGLVDPIGEILLKTLRPEERPLWSLVMVGREGRAVLVVDEGSFLVSLCWECGAMSIIATIVGIHTSSSTAAQPDEIPTAGNLCFGVSFRNCQKGIENGRKRSDMHLERMAPRRGGPRSQY